MQVIKPRINQWVIYGDNLELGKVVNTMRRYHTRGSKPRAWGPVEKVCVLQRNGYNSWHPIEKIKVILPSEARKMYAKETNRLLGKTPEN